MNGNGAKKIQRFLHNQKNIPVRISSIRFPILTHFKFRATKKKKEEKNKQTNKKTTKLE